MRVDNGYGLWLSMTNDTERLITGDYFSVDGRECYLTMVNPWLILWFLLLEDE